MSETTSGARRILSHAAVYELWSRAVGGERARSIFIEKHVRPASDARVLDLGCGTGELLNHLPADVSYVGIDLSPQYISRADHRLGTRGSFRVGDATAFDPGIGEFDLVVAFGVLHHLDDAGARALFGGAAEVLAAGGRVVTIDPVFAPGQSRAARTLMARDRGQHVRRPGEYVALAGACALSAVNTVYHDLLRIPYSHCVVEAQMGGDAA